jgi:hypothetical protein
MTSTPRPYHSCAIGVVARAEDRPAVEEFFELFKTPWEFYRPGSRYDVVLDAEGSGAWSAADEAARLLLVYGAKSTAFDEAVRRLPSAPRSNVIVSALGDRVPIYGSCASVTSHGGVPDVELDDTHEPVASVRRVDGRTIVRVGYDLFAEVRHLLTTGQPATHAASPTLERHIALLRRWIVGSGLPLIELPPVPDGHDFAVCLTHDVDHASLRLHRLDHTMFGFLHRASVRSVVDLCRGRAPMSRVRRNLAAALRLPFVYLGWAEDFWSHFDRYVDIEKGLGSTFFFIPSKRTAGRTRSGTAPRLRASAYDVNDVAETARRLASTGCDVGVHGIDAWLDSASGVQERDRVSRAAGTPASGVRMHWLYFDEEAPRRLEDAGFAWDSTFGYNDAVGFRAGTLQAFKPITARQLLELPLHVMDTALFYPTRLNLTPDAAGRAVAPVIDEAARYGGALTINWHDRSIAPERLWDGFYVDLLGDLKRRSAWFVTASQAVAWFRRRRSAHFDGISSDGTALRVAASAQSGEEGPALTLRLHRPWPSDAPWPPPSSTRPLFTDVAFKDSVDTRVEL